MECVGKARLQRQAKSSRNVNVAESPIQLGHLIYVARDCTILNYNLPTNKKSILCYFFSFLRIRHADSMYVYHYTLAFKTDFLQGHCSTKF